MIDNRLVFHTPNPDLENIISSIPKINLDKYKRNSDLIANLTVLIYKDTDISLINNFFVEISIPEHDKNVLLGFLLAKTIIDQDIKNIFEHINWLDHVLSCDNYISQSYFYYLKKLLDNKNFYSNYIEKIRQYYEYCNNNPEKLFIPHRYDKKTALKVLSEWNNTSDYYKVISGEWKNFYEYLFIDQSYCILKPLIDKKCFKPITHILFTINNFFILDNILSYNDIRYDMDFIKNIFDEIKEQKDEYLIITFLLIHKIHDYLSCLYKRFENISAEIEDKTLNILQTLDNQKNNHIIYKHWLKFLTNQIINNNDVDLSIILIETITKQLKEKCLIDNYKKELITDKNSPYENLMTLILFEDTPNFNKGHYELLEEYLLDKKQYIYVNLYQVNKAFEPRFYYLSQLFIGNEIGEKEWLKLWNLIYDDRKEVIYPYFYKRDSKSMYRSIFLIITGIAAIQYLCKENREKSSKFLDYVWQATKEIYLFNSRFYDGFIVEVIFRLVILSEIIGENAIKYLNFIKFNPSILTQVLTSLQKNNYNIESLTKDKAYLESVEVYVKQLMNKEHVSQEYKLLCEQLLNSLV